MRYMDTDVNTHMLFIDVSWSRCYHTVPDHIMAREFHLCYKFCHHKRTNRDSAGKAVLLGGHSSLGLRRSPQEWPRTSATVMPLAFVSFSLLVHQKVFLSGYKVQVVSPRAYSVDQHLWEMNCSASQQRLQPTPWLCRDFTMPLEVWGLRLGFSRCSGRSNPHVNVFLMYFVGEGKLHVSLLHHPNAIY